MKLQNAHNSSRAQKGSFNTNGEQVHQGIIQQTKIERNDSSNTCQAANQLVGWMNASTIARIGSFKIVPMSQTIMMPGPSPSFALLHRGAPRHHTDAQITGRRRLPHQVSGRDRDTQDDRCGTGVLTGETRRQASYAPAHAQQLPELERDGRVMSSLSQPREAPTKLKV